MSRMIKIIITQLRELSFQDFLSLLKKNIYCCEPILIYIRKTDEECSDRQSIPDDFVIEKGKIGDLEKMKGRMIPLPWEFQCHEFDSVMDFFVARNMEGIQHISWIYYHNNRNRLLSLKEDEAEIKFCLTLPAARGLGIYPKVITSIARYLNQKGVRRIFMCVHEENQPSIRGIEKAGFHQVGMIHLKKFLGVQVSKRFDTSEV